MLPVVNSDGSGSIVGVISPLDVILKALEPVESGASLAKAQRHVR